MAATAPILHSDQQNLSQLVGENLSLAQGTGLLLDADVGGSKTLVTMKAALIANAALLPAEFQGYVDRLSRALDYGGALGVLSTANIQGVTTLDELIAICPTDANKLGGPLAIE